MNNLARFVTTHTAAVSREGAEFDLMFFGVNTKDEADVTLFKGLIADHKSDVCAIELDPFDGNEHNYMQLGAWIGDQGVAMQFMALGAKLGLWQLLTPKVMLGNMVPDETQMQMAQRGMITIVHK